MWDLAAAIVLCYFKLSGGCRLQLHPGHVRIWQLHRKPGAHINRLQSHSRGWLGFGSYVYALHRGCALVISTQDFRLSVLA